MNQPNAEKAAHCKFEAETSRMFARNQRLMEERKAGGEISAPGSMAAYDEGRFARLAGKRGCPFHRKDWVDEYWRGYRAQAKREGVMGDGE